MRSLSGIIKLKISCLRNLSNFISESDIFILAIFYQHIFPQVDIPMKLIRPEYLWLKFISWIKWENALTSQKYLPTTYQAAWDGCACPVLSLISCFHSLKQDVSHPCITPHQKFIGRNISRTSIFFLLRNGERAGLKSSEMVKYGLRDSFEFLPES